MGVEERVGLARGHSIEVELGELGHRLDTYKRYINLQGKAIEELGAICAAMQTDGKTLAARVEELEAELSYRLMPLWRRAAIQTRHTAGASYALVLKAWARWQAIRQGLWTNGDLEPLDPVDLPEDATAFQDYEADKVRPWPPN